jgi:hypothetical protein
LRKSIRERVNPGDEPLNPLLKLAARASRVKAHKTVSLFAVGISRHDGDFLLLNQDFLQRFVINAQRA